MNTRPRSECTVNVPCFPSNVNFELATYYYYFAVVFRITEEDYVKAIKEEINKVVKLQEELDIDVLVHGEPEVSYISYMN